MKLRKITFFAVIAAVTLAAFGIVAVFFVTPKAAQADFADILLGNAEFLYVSEGASQPKTVSDVPALFDPYDDYMKIWDFAIQDLDGDQNPEVILSVQGISGDTGGNLILHQIGDKVYGYLIGNRYFMYLKTDGRYNYAEPVSVHEAGIASIDQFTKTGCTVDKITYGRIYTNLHGSNYEDCVVEHQPAAEEEFIAALDAHNQKPDAVWYDFTEENIKSCFDL